MEHHRGTVAANRHLRARRPRHGQRQRGEPQRQHRLWDSRCYDAGKKINGRKRFIVTDTLGLLVVVCVMAPS